MSNHHYLEGDAGGRHEGRAEPMEGPLEPETVPAPLVLIVDDFEDSRAMYSAYARVCGFDVAEAGDGISALEKAKALMPQCIVIDLALPQLDGWEVVRRLRAEPSTRAIPVIAVSGHTLESHTRAAHEAGCDDFLPKPCLPDVLMDRIRKVLKS
jgi:CheY-like chemotaxis protein